MKKRFILTAGGVDKKGIVFDLTKMLGQYNFNIEDSSMVMMRQTFSVIMLLTRANNPEKAFKDSLNNFMKKHGMIAGIKEISEKEMKEYKVKGKIYLISINGADKPGIVKTITEILYKKGANITGLETKSSEKVKPHAYYMFLETDIPKKVKVKALEKLLKKEGKKIGVHITIKKVDDSVL